MAAQQITYEGVLKMFRKTGRRMAKMSQETDRKIREVAEQQAKTAAQQAKTERTVERAEQAIGRLGNRIGDIIEHMVGGENIVKTFHYRDNSQNA